MLHKLLVASAYLGIAVSFEHNDLGGASASSANQQAPRQQALTGVNESQPTTTLQIRLSDGSKLTGKFNLSQTIQDVKR